MDLEVVCHSKEVAMRLVTAKVLAAVTLAFLMHGSADAFVKFSKKKPVFHPPKKVVFPKAQGGNGGNANAKAGNGGNAKGKGSKGGNGGNANATAGNGGNAVGAKSRGGNGGKANATPGNGGHAGGAGGPGGECGGVPPPRPPRRDRHRARAR